jgi:signal peptidase II
MIIAGLAAGIAAGLCTLARWYLERSSLRTTGWGGCAVLQPLYNEGAGFGCGWLWGRGLLAGSAAALAALLWEIRHNRNSLAKFGAGLALGGGIGNLWERIRHGRVFDYIRFPRAPGRLGQWVFNLADFFIFIGIGCLLLGSLRRKK